MTNIEWLNFSQFESSWDILVIWFFIEKDENFHFASIQILQNIFCKQFKKMQPNIER